MTRKQKLELTWVGKDEQPRLEPRILVEDAALSYHAPHRVRDDDRFDNMLIQGDNLLALKALEQEYAGKVKCVFIDPPYNTGSAFEHYDDGIEHSLWLSMIRDRLEVIDRLLAVDGSLWITIDDNEGHYLKVLCDELFGRQRFVANVVWQSKDTPGNNASGFAQTHNHLLVYGGREGFRPVLKERSPEQLANYANPDDDPRGPWLAAPLTRAEHRDRDVYPLGTPDGREVSPPAGSSWRRPPDKMRELAEDNRIWWGRNGLAEFPMEKKFLNEVKEGVVNQTWWPYEFAGSTRQASAEMKALFGGTKAFDTPKPERLLLRVFEASTLPGDLVLDSFLGSGTTAAVAHMLSRRWIGIEQGTHAQSLCAPRIKRLIDGDYPTGTARDAGWAGGGGFRFYRLAPSLLEKDQWGNWVISRDYDAAMLAEALCKLEGFHYAPNAEAFWQHGHSTERDFIYVTTQTLSAAQLEWLSDAVGPDRSLLILCGAWLGHAATWPNLTLKKIPNAVLGRCEFGRDDYSLQIASLPNAPEPAAAVAATTSVAPMEAPPRRRGRRRAQDPAQELLLDDEVTP